MPDTTLRDRLAAAIGDDLFDHTQSADPAAARERADGILADPELLAALADHHRASQPTAAAAGPRGLLNTEHMLAGVLRGYSEAGVGLPWLHWSLPPDPFATKPEQLAEARERARLAAEEIRRGVAFGPAWVQFVAFDANPAAWLHLLNRGEPPLTEQQRAALDALAEFAQAHEVEVDSAAAFSIAYTGPPGPGGERTITATAIGGDPQMIVVARILPDGTAVPSVGSIEWEHDASVPGGCPVCEPYGARR